MRSKTLGAMLIALSALAVCAAPAGAIVANTANGRVGYLPLNGSPASAAAPKGFTEPTGEPPLVYHGGPVMHSHAAYAIFWAPSGFSFPAGYTAAIEDFLKNVAADSGKPSNVYSVSAQYTDGTGHAAYSDTYEDAGPTRPPTRPVAPVRRTSALAANRSPPASPTPNWKTRSNPSSTPRAGRTGWEPSTTSSSRLTPEAASARPWPRAASTGNSAPTTASANPPETSTPTSATRQATCSAAASGSTPTASHKGNVDDTLSSLSHEANESITDPELNAWFDFEGFENGDECRNTPEEEDFGSPLGGAPGALFNQEIGSANYYLQQEWSNDIEDCAQRVTPAAPVIADPGQVFSGESASFDGSGSAPGSGGIVPGSFEWDFGDTHTASGPTPTHTYATTGTFTVTLTVEDDAGFTYSTTREVEVTSPPPPLPPEASAKAPSGLGDSGVTLNGGVNPKGRHTHYHFEFGTTTAYGSSTPNADAGSGLSEVAATAVPPAT